MKFDKIKDESGSTLLLALFLIVLISIVIISFSVQVGNQIKSTKKTDEGIQVKYNRESHIEEIISNFIGDLRIVLRDEDSEITKIEMWEREENGKIVTYEQEIRYIYYEVYYDTEQNVEVDGKNIMGASVKQILPRLSTEKRPLKIFSHTSPQAKELNIDEFDGTKQQTLVFNMEINEINDEINTDDDLKSVIEITLNNINGQRDKEVCNISYEVKYWRNK